MSMSKVSSKSKETQDGFNTFSFTSSFDRARQIFQEIESILENELADTPQIVANYEQNVARVKSKRKRGGPFLIKPLNKSKARKTLNDMEFDPVLGVWVGNDEIMKNFAGHQPALIINKGRHDKPKTFGKMVWDPKEHKWRGNEEDLRVFETRARPLISKLSIDLNLKEINGMTFDPIKMAWVGNDADLLDFGTISESSPDDGFVVGTEFQLSLATTQLFLECANRHRANTSGWWQDDKSRSHLQAIRMMSIMRVVRDVRRTAFSYYEEPADMDIANEKESSLALKSPNAIIETDLDDAWNDIGPFVGSAKLKLPDVESSVDIDVELDQEVNNDEKKVNRNSTKHVVDEDWDTDFTDDIDKLNNKITSIKTPTTLVPPPGTLGTPGTFGTPGTISGVPSGSVINLSALNASNKEKGLEKKPFALLKSDAPHRRSFILPTDSVKKPKASDEDEETGLEFPTEPLRLKLNRPAPSSSTEDDHEHVDLDGEDSGSNHEEPYEVEEEEVEEVEEDWTDVEVPTSLGDPITKRPEMVQKLTYHPPPEKEEWDDIEIPTEKLALKMSQQKLGQEKPQKQKSRGDEDWDDLEIPDNFQLRLKKK